MNKASLGILALVTMVILMIALQVNQNDDNAPDLQPAPIAALFPELSGQLESVNSIEINSPDGVFKISKQNDIWGLDSKHGYPVAHDKVAQVLNGMVSLTRIEAKTQKAALHQKLDLQDRSIEGAQSTQVSLSDADRKVADILIGKTSMAKADTSLQEMYVRLPSENQTWLAHTPMRLEKNPDNWLDKTIVQVSEKRIQSVSVTPATGETVQISKSEVDAAEFQLEGLPAGAKVEKAYQLGSIANVLGNLTLDDVKLAKDSQRPADLNQAVFKTFDGLRVQMDISKQDDNYWASFSAQADPLANPDTTSTDKIDVIKEASDINSRTQGWLYQVPSYKMENLLKPRTELFSTAEALANRDSHSNETTPLADNPFAAALANADTNKQGGNVVDQRQALDLLKSLGR